MSQMEALQGALFSLGFQWCACSACNWFPSPSLGAPEVKNTHGLNHTHWVAITCSCQQKPVTATLNTFLQWHWWWVTGLYCLLEKVQQQNNKDRSDYSPKACFQDNQNSAGSVHPSGLTKPRSFAEDMPIYPIFVWAVWDSLVFITGPGGSGSESSPASDWISCSQVRAEILQIFPELDITTHCLLKCGCLAEVTVTTKITEEIQIFLSLQNSFDSL